MKKAADRLCGNVTINAYKDGWHLVFRDLQAEQVWRDVAGWIKEENASDPLEGGGSEAGACAAGERLKQF